MEYLTVSLTSPYLVINVPHDVQMSLTAKHSLVKPPQHL